MAPAAGLEVGFLAPLLARAAAAGRDFEGMLALLEGGDWRTDDVAALRLGAFHQHRRQVVDALSLELVLAVERERAAVEVDVFGPPDGDAANRRRREALRLAERAAANGLLVNLLRTAQIAGDRHLDRAVGAVAGGVRTGRCWPLTHSGARTALP